jgi:hypothetical protein
MYNECERYQRSKIMILVKSLKFGQLQMVVELPEPISIIIDHNN